MSYEWFLSGEIFYTIINTKARKFCINIQEATTGGIILNQNTIKVLLADDNKDFCDIIVDHLNKQEDITVVAVAMDGIDAMNKIRDTHPDVAVIDGIMPRLDGLGVLERLQKTEEEHGGFLTDLSCQQPADWDSLLLRLRPLHSP